MSIEYNVICKKTIDDIGGIFKIKQYKKYSCRNATSINGDDIFIIEDNNHQRCSFNTKEFKEYFYTKIGMRKLKIEKLNNYEEKLF